MLHDVEVSQPPLYGTMLYIIGYSHDPFDFLSSDLMFTDGYVLVSSSSWKQHYMRAQLV